MKSNFNGPYDPINTAILLDKYIKLAESTDERINNAVENHTHPEYAQTTEVQELVNTHKHVMADITDYSESQADYNQNDETAADYIKNRTHYVGYEPTLLDVTWQNIQMAMIDGGAVTFAVDGTTYENVPMGEKEMYGLSWLAWSFGEYEVAVDPIMSLVEITPEGADVKVVSYTEVVHSLDEKFIPDSIARMLIVNLSMDEQGNMTADKTFAEIKAAIDSGASVWCDVEGIRCSFALVEAEAIVFESPVFSGMAELLNFLVVINSGNTVVIDAAPYPDMGGATETASGVHGLVPAPAAGDQNKVLSGAGTWIDVPDVPNNSNIFNGGAEGSLRSTTAVDESLSYSLGMGATAFGAYTQAEGECSHAEGYATRAEGVYSHAEGSATTASGTYSHAEGQYNLPNKAFQFMQGGGHPAGSRRNLHTRDHYGNGWYASAVYVGGTPTGDDTDVNFKRDGTTSGATVNYSSCQKLATENYVDEAVADINIPTDEYINNLIEAKLIALRLISNESSNS